MNIRRGYQGNTTLSDGSVFTLGGSWSESTTINGGKDAELWSPETGWINLPGIEGEDIWNNNDLATEIRGLYRIDNHLWLWPAPNGKIFHAGPSERMHWIDVANGGSITDAGQRGTDTYSMKGNTVMFDTGKILKTGGAQSYDSNHPAKDNAFVIDINGANPVVTPTLNNLAYSRTMQNSTVLPNGEVLVTGGLDHAEVFSDTGARYQAEIYNPTTNQWRTVASMANARTYHSVAILLLDGRVFVGGGGLCDYTPGCVNHQDAEIYSPPYLFTTGGALAARPTISAPATTAYNTSIAVTGSTNIASFNLIRSSAVTHSTNNEQRRIPVTHTGSGGNYSVNIPDRNLLPPGYYMLFAMNTNGVPSVAEMIKVGSAVPIQNNPNLVMHLEFEETSGSTAFDSSSNGNDGTIYNVTNDKATKTPSTTNWTSQGLFGGAVQMDGNEFVSNTLIDVATSSSLTSIQQSVTVMAWVNRNNLQYNVGILSHDYPNLFFGFHNSMFKWEFPTATGGNAHCYSGYSPQNEWVHIAATYDGTTARLFANGVEVCTQAVSGNFNFNTSEPNFSSFTSSGFYDRRTPAQIQNLVGYTVNGSGATDEVNGKIDELKVYNKALGAEEIKMFFDLGAGLPDVPNCPSGTIVAEYKLGTGPWTPVTGNNINAPEGSQIFIRAQTSGEYFITTAQKDYQAPTLSSLTDFTQANGYQIDTQVTDPGGNNTLRNDGLIDYGNQGQFVLTTAGGCPTVINLQVVSGCDSGDVPIQAEWRIAGGSYQSANVGETANITATVGDEVRLSILPNTFPSTSTQIGFSVTLPNGSVSNASFSRSITDHIIPAAALSDAGTYVLTSEEGCTAIINLAVDGFDCTEIKAEWSKEGGAFGSYEAAPNANPITVNAYTGDDISLSLLPNGVNYTITHNSAVVYTGNTDYALGIVDPSDSGAYILTTVQGCSTTLTLNVTDIVCDATTLKAEWRLNGAYVEAPNAQPVTVNALTGDAFEISMVPNGTDYTIDYAGNEVYSGDLDYDLGTLTIAKSGVYTLTTEYGCTTTLTLNVSDVVCDGSQLMAEWRLNGDYFSAPDNLPITVDVPTGDAFEISILPNGIPFTIDYEGNEVYNDQYDYDLGNVTPADSGDYIITTTNGCTTTLTLNVLCPSGPFTAEATVNGTASSGSATLTVNTGDTVVLSTVENNVAFTITDPNAVDTTGDLDLGAITLAQAGLYTFTSAEGCTTTLTIVVQNPCAAGTFTPQYTLDGVAASGDATITVDEGTPVVLGIVQTNVTYTITPPNGSPGNGQLDLGNITAAQAGAYTFTSATGCSATLTIVVENACPAGSFTPEYTLDGLASSGAMAITVAEGTTVVLGLVQANVTYTITPANGTPNNGELDLGAITPAQAGAYTYTSDNGCEVVLTVNVSTATDPCPTGSFTPQYTIDGVASSGETTITVTEGTPLILAVVQAGFEYTITLPNAATNAGALDLGTVVLAQAGTYGFASASGCSATLTVIVESTTPEPNPEAQLKDVKIYPNPIGSSENYPPGKMYIELKDFMDETINVAIFDIYGKLVLRNVILANHGTDVELDISMLSQGTYIVEILRTQKDEYTIKKVIKLK